MAHPIRIKTARRYLENSGLSFVECGAESFEGASLTAARTAEVFRAKWSEIDLEAKMLQFASSSRR
jgi:hypothetical protein